MDTHAAHVGKGQFYHYFSSKYELGLAVVEDLIQEWDQQLIVGILQSTDNPKSKLNKNQLNIHFLTNVIDVIRKQLHLS